MSFTVRHRNGKREVRRTNPHVLRVGYFWATGLVLAWVGTIPGLVNVGYVGGGLVGIGILYLFMTVGVSSVLRAVKWCWNGGGRHNG